MDATVLLTNTYLCMNVTVATGLVMLDTTGIVVYIACYYTYIPYNHCDSIPSRPYIHRKATVYCAVQ